MELDNNQQLHLFTSSSTNAATMSTRRKGGHDKSDMGWSIRAGIGKEPSANALLKDKEVTGAPSAAASSQSTSSPYPMTSGGLYDLDTLDEELVTATGPSSSAIRYIEPKLDNLKSVQKNPKSTFKEMIRAADADAANHAARMRKYQAAAAAVGGDGGNTGGAGREASSWRERIERRKKWDAKASALQKEAATIVRLIDTPIEGTQAEVAKERLARWQRALELYVYCPDESGVDLLKLLEKLIEGCGEVSTLCLWGAMHYLLFDTSFVLCYAI